MFGRATPCQFTRMKLSRAMMYTCQDGRFKFLTNPMLPIRCLETKSRQRMVLGHGHLPSLILQNAVLAPCILSSTLISQGTPGCLKPWKIYIISLSPPPGHRRIVRFSLGKIDTVGCPYINCDHSTSCLPCNWLAASLHVSYVRNN